MAAIFLWVSRKKRKKFLASSEDLSEETQVYGLFGTQAKTQALVKISKSIINQSKHTLPFLLLPSSWWIPDKEQPLLPHGSLLSIKGSKALISFVIMAVGNKQTKEKEKLIQKYFSPPPVWQTQPANFP